MSNRCTARALAALAKAIYFRRVMIQIACLSKTTFLAPLPFLRVLDRLTSALDESRMSMRCFLGIL